VSDRAKLAAIREAAPQQDQPKEKSKEKDNG
jgi:hypothetical protein